MQKENGLILLGGGGHAAACLDVVESIRDYSISLGGKVHVALQVKDTRELSDIDWLSLSNRFSGFILGVGMIHDNTARRNIFEKVKSCGGKFATIISPFAHVSPTAKIGEGTIVMHHVSVNTRAFAGCLNILNTGCVLEHDALIGENCHLSTGSVVNGECHIGNHCFIGSNAVILNQIKVTDYTTVGAGSVVIKDINEQGCIYVGNPAKFLRKKA